MKCLNCQSEIPDDAEICPYCNDAPPSLKFIVSIVAGIVLLLTGILWIWLAAPGALPMAGAAALVVITLIGLTLYWLSTREGKSK